MTDSTKSIKSGDAGTLRILGLIFAIICLLESCFFFIDDGRFFLSWGSVIGLGVFFLPSLVGLIAGWRWRLWGGILMLTPFIALLVYDVYSLIRFHHLFGGLIFVLPSIIAAGLFIVSSLMHRKNLVAAA